MTEYCVAVSAGSRARFFTLEKSHIPEMESGPNLQEIGDLVNPERGGERALWSEKKSGRNRAPTGGMAHGYDDHRDQHIEESERRFARSVAEEAARLAHSRRASHVVLVAQKRTLGFLRDALDPLLKTGVEVRELAKDLTKLSPHEVHAHLAREELLPARRHPTGLQAPGIRNQAAGKA